MLTIPFYFALVDFIIRFLERFGFAFVAGSDFTWAMFVFFTVAAAGTIFFGYITGSSFSLSVSISIGSSFWLSY